MNALARTALQASSLILHPSSFKKMWNDRLRFVEQTEAQWKGLSEEDRNTLKKAFELIDEDPILGAPLLEPLRGYWSYRAGALRVIYRIVAEARFVVVLWMGKA
jgi:mRNA-degrading endonuclease RelE of RelBE toxin-antitoxin system